MRKRSLLHCYQYGIYYADLEKNSEGAEVNGYQKVVILQNMVGNRNSQTTVIAPLTTNKKQLIETINKNRSGEWKEYSDHQISYEQIRVIDKERIHGDSIGYFKVSHRKNIRKELSEFLFKNKSHEKGCNERRQLYIADLGNAVGYEFKGITPVIVLQSINEMLIVVPVNILLKREKTPTHILLRAEESGLKRTGVILTEQIRAIDKSRLIIGLGEVSEKILQRVNVGIRTNLGLI